jgi:hypothetical protein
MYRSSYLEEQLFMPYTPKPTNKYKQAERLAKLLAAGKQKEAVRLAGSARLWAQRDTHGWIIGQHGKKEPLLSPTRNENDCQTD